jgi:hypothetical protein
VQLESTADVAQRILHATLKAWLHRRWTDIGNKSVILCLGWKKQAKNDGICWGKVGTGTCLFQLDTPEKKPS